jgi:hypothetical protein
MSSGGNPLPSRAVIIAVACLSVAAATSLVNMAGSVFGFSRALVDRPIASPGLFILSTNLSFVVGDKILIMAGSGAVAGAVGLLVLHRAPRVGWVWLLVAGTVLTAALVIPILPAVPNPNTQNSSLLYLAIGAGPVAVIMGLLGAGSWLMHVTGTGTGAMVVGVALAAPFLGAVALPAVLGDLSSVDGLRVLNVSLAAVSIAGAVGVATLLPRISRTAPPPRPTWKFTAVGVLAALLLAVPDLVLRSAWDRSPSAALSPEDPFTDYMNRWAVVVGLCGLVTFALAIGLSAMLGSRVLGAALGVGLVLYGVTIAVNLSAVSIHSRTDALILAVVGLGLGCVAAMTRWRAWFACVGCAGAGIATILALGGPPAAVATVLFAIFGFAAVTAVAAAASALSERTQVPAVLGAVAVAIQVGLILSGAVLMHSDLGAGEFLARQLSVAAGIALLLGALLAVAIPLIRTPAPPTSQATLSPELPVAK